MFKKVSLSIGSVVLGVLLLYAGMILINFMNVFEMIDTSHYTIMQHTNYDFVYVFGAIGAIVGPHGSYIIPIVINTKIWKK
jgi:hypothetical protein